jgi:hypothetical protein
MNDAEWINFYIGGQLCVWMNVCMRMNHFFNLLISDVGDGLIR